MFQVGDMLKSHNDSYIVLDNTQSDFYSLKCLSADWENDSTIKWLVHVEYELFTDIFRKGYTKGG